MTALGRSASEKPRGRVRSATPADLKEILEIERLSFPESKRWDADEMRLALNDLFLVSEDDGVHGFLIASWWEEGKKGFILRIAVHPDHRNRGAATMLLSAAIARLRELGAQEVEIDVEITRRGAARLYEKAGFRAVRVVPMNDDYSMADENGSFWIMRMRLEER